MDLYVPRGDVLDKTEKFIQNRFENEGSGHDWWHIFRVRNLSLKIAQIEGGNKFIIEMVALLHDLDDWKLSGTEDFSKTQSWLKKMQISETDKGKIISSIKQVSFKGAEVETKAPSLEAGIVQDADRLDAMGAIGIARTFAYGGSKGRLIYHPEIKPELHKSFEDYKKTNAPTINHFYEKLLLLKERLNTKTAKKIALKRHEVMEWFLSHFFEEWENGF